LHGSFVFGFVIAGAVGLDALIMARWERILLGRWIGFGVLSLAAAMLNANGLAGVLHPLTVAGMDTLPLIQEWQPSTPLKTPWFFAILAAIVAAMLVKRVRPKPGEAALLVLMLGMALWQVRHQSWLAIVVALLVTPYLALGRRADAATFGSPKEKWVGLSIAACAAVLLIVGRLMVPLVPDENSANPRNLIAHIPNAMRNQPVLNGYTMGGPLILAGVSPYIDGRADMYGDSFFADYKAITDGDVARFNRAVVKYGIRWTILPAGNNRLVKALDSIPEWHRVYEDKVGVIHVRGRKAQESAEHSAPPYFTQQ
jgi:hypothetical protein